MNKFQAIAARVAEQRQKLDARADDLMVRLDGIDSRAAQAFEKHEAAADQAEKDIAEMEASLREFAGGNNPPPSEGEGSADTSETSFRPGGPA